MKIVKEILRAVTPYSIRKKRYYYNILNGKEREKLCEERIREIENKNHVNVLFLASLLPMWRYQELVDILSKDSRFNVSILICPFRRYLEDEAKNTVKELKTYFASRGLDVPSTTDPGFNLDEWFGKVNPDIIFYCQHYENFYDNIVDYEHNGTKLWGYIPYGLLTMRENLVYNTEFHNLAWRVYEPTALHLTTARKIMANDARNVRIVGEPHADRYLGERGDDPWRKMNDDKVRKRVIWAPHFSIQEHDILHRASFLWLSDNMVEIARKYADSVQFAFKPHPHLYDVLCKHSAWGKKKTDAYYRLWAEMPNTQLESGEFIELFMHSDGMIHDCGSFTGEYMFTRKPVMFMSKDINRIRKDADDFGSRCLDLHNIGESANDAERFIEDIILSGNDNMKEKREQFYAEYLLPPNGNTVAENIYNDLVNSLRLQ